MTTYWLEIHCEGHGGDHITWDNVCHSNHNNNPGALTTNLTRGKRNVESAARDMGWKRMSFGWLCPVCFKLGYKPK